MQNPIIMQSIDLLTGRQFELFTGKLLTDLGYHEVEVTPAVGDYGIDVLATDAFGTRIGIQCKHIKSGERIGYRAVEETSSGVMYYGLDKGIVLTNQYYTHNAKKGARQNKIALCNRDKIKSIISHNKSKNSHVVYRTIYKHATYANNHVNLATEHIMQLPKLSLTERVILADIYNNQSSDDGFNQSNKIIGQKFNVSPYTVSRELAYLTRHHYISVNIAINNTRYIHFSKQNLIKLGLLS